MGLRRYDIHGYLAVETNMKKVEIPRYFMVKRPIKPDIRISEGELGKIGPLRPLGLRLLVGDRVLVHRCLSLIDMRLVLKDLLGSGGPTEIRFNRPYRLFRELVQGISLWHLLKLIIMVRLLSSAGLTFAHASCVAIDGQASLFSGWSDVGKTATAIGLVRAGGGDVAYMAEDITIVGPGGLVLSWPSIPRRVVARPFERAPLLRKITVRGERLLPPDVKKEHKAKIAKVFFLIPGPRERPRRLGQEEAFKKLVLATDMAFNFASELILLAYSYADPSFDILSLRERHIDLLRELTSRADCIELRAPGPEGFIEQAKALLC